MAVPDQIRNDRPHPARNHRAREPEEVGHVVAGQHLGVDVDSLVDCGRADPGLAVLRREFAYGHPAPDPRVADGRLAELLAVGVVARRLLVVAVGVVAHTLLWTVRGVRSRGPASRRCDARRRGADPSGLGSRSQPSRVRQHRRLDAPPVDEVREPFHAEGLGRVVAAERDGDPRLPGLVVDLLFPLAGD